MTFLSTTMYKKAIYIKLFFCKWHTEWYISLQWFHNLQTSYNAFAHRKPTYLSWDECPSIHRNKKTYHCIGLNFLLKW